MRSKLSTKPFRMDNPQVQQALGSTVPKVLRKYVLKTTCRESFITKKLKKEESRAIKVLNSQKLSFVREKISQSTLPSAVSHHDPNTFYIGLLAQSPTVSHSNLAKLINDFAPQRMAISNWQFDDETQSKYNCELMTATDFFPFRKTFGDAFVKKTSSDKKERSVRLPKKPSKKKTKATVTGTVESSGKAKAKESNAVEFVPDFWREMPNNVIKRSRDSVGRTLPKLTRKTSGNGSANDGDAHKQECFIFRERGFDLRNTTRIKSVLSELRPDVVVFEWSKHEFFSKQFAQQSRVHKALKRFLTDGLSSFGFVSDYASVTLGTNLYNILRPFYKNELGSFATQTALHWCNSASVRRRPVPVVCADLHWKYTDTVKHFVSMFDVHCVAALSQMKLIDDRLFRPENYSKLPLPIWDLVAHRIKPHLCTLNGFRNDVLTATINELCPVKYPSVLVICSATRVSDLKTRLEGRRGVNAWITRKDAESVSLKRLPAEVTAASSFHHSVVDPSAEDTLDTDDIANACKHFGFENMAFLLTPIQKDTELSDFKETVRAKAAELRQQFS